ncbi:peptidylprolyl isomerase [Polynucleobacter sp. MWH-Loch1C5]|uniref:peptidylprolyl isomerase n=1 Tax=Polynucleobacter sp. MWH-Loch1C5 TaxID=2689108 RepID=UPI001C0D7807|nr:peptidylprolyl isomerase [Polynucleobacter sp. MWH-Loch1C5]MBU3541660.1 peptidylprolyl isomerase [Polynucleobacter sp. MWH-Loch1C5]
MKKNYCLVLAATFFSISLHAQSLPKGSVAVVNGKNLTEALLEQNVKANLAQGLADSPELRKALTEELVNRELLAQDATKKNLHNTADVQLQLEQVRRNLLAELALNEFLKNKTITDEQLKKEYEAQIKALGDTSNLQQYKIRQILSRTEADARTAMNRLKKEAFEKVAQEVSIDSSRERGGDLGWVLPNQIIPVISNVMVNLNKGSTSIAPIQSPNGWHIIKVEDKRAFKVPSFEDSKERLRASMMQQMRIEYVQQLRKDAKIQQ